MTKRKKPEDFLPDGRPTKYREEYCEQAFKLCLLGYTDNELADFFNVNPDTIHEWKKVHPKFSESLTRGKENADSDVAKKLYERAMGYSHPEEKIFCVEGEIVRAKTKKHYPPDPTSMIFWLKNRQMKKWRDKIDADVKHSGQIIINLDSDDSKL